MADRRDLPWSDANPKEQFLYHNAGRAEPGASSSYIDAVVLRDRDMTNGWAGAADGTLEQRIFYCQNWRADVVALVTSGGAQVQQVRYGEYGEAFGMPTGDTDGDGDVNSGNNVDSDQIQTWINGSAYDVRGDLDLDGDVDATDKTAAIAMAGTVLGWGSLSLSVGSSAGGNRKGYAGYENDGVLDAAMIYHVRNRVYHAGLERWTKRDPIGYVEGVNLYNYVRTNPLAYFDPSGLLIPPPPPAIYSPAVPAIESAFYQGVRLVLVEAAVAPGAAGAISDCAAGVRVAASTGQAVAPGVASVSESSLLVRGAVAVVTPITLTASAIAVPVYFAADYAIAEWEAASLRILEENAKGLCRREVDNLLKERKKKKRDDGTCQCMCSRTLDPLQGEPMGRMKREICERLPELQPQWGFVKCYCRFK